jgi:hypothetical protein
MARPSGPLTQKQGPREVRGDFRKNFINYLLAFGSQATGVQNIETCVMNIFIIYIAEADCFKRKEDDVTRLYVRQ